LVAIRHQRKPAKTKKGAEIIELYNFFRIRKDVKNALTLT
jgi:hypothetical protein